MQSFTDINKKFDRLIIIKQKKLVLLGGAEKYMVFQRNEVVRNKKINDKRKYTHETAGGSFIDTVLNIGVMFAAFKLAEWVANPSNKDAIEKLLKFGKGLFDTASSVAGFGAGNLLDGLTKVSGDKSILAKMFGGLQAVVGLVSLRWLLNPLKIIKDIKSIPKLLGKLNNVGKLLNASLADIGKWSKAFVKGIFGDIGKFFSKGILKVFGKHIWKYLRKLVNGVYKGVGNIAGKTIGRVASGATKLVGKLIPSTAIRTFGKFLTKIPIVGSLLGFGINMLLGDPVEKAAFKFATAATGTWIGGAVGSIFPPAIPFTATIGGLLGDWLGDTLFDKFVPPKLALGGVVSHQSKEGTHVIVAEDEDEVVIPLSMLRIDNAIGAKMFEPMKIIGSNILGAVQSVINTNGEVYSNISSDITASLVPLSKMFGVSIVTSKSITKGYVQSSNNVSNLTNNRKNDNILRNENLTKITQTNTLGNITSTSVRGLLHSILDVIVNSNAISGGKGKMNTTMNTPPAIVQDVNQNSPTKDVPGTLIASGMATYYDPNDKNDTTAGGQLLSTGERYNSKTFSGAVFPDLILKLPERYTAPTTELPQYFKGKTIKKAFMVKMVMEKNGKQAYVRINDVGKGVLGDHSRLVDMSAATKKYFGGDNGGVKVYLAPDNAKAGALPDLPKLAAGGEYTFNNAPVTRWSGFRQGRKHAGEDIAMRKDGTFQSWVGGTVMLKGYQPGNNLYGNYIDIYNSKLKVTERIAEATDIKVKVGDVVQPGQIVSSGSSTGVIHYEIRPMDKYEEKYYFAGTVDPVKYLSGIGAATIAGNNIKNNALATLIDGISDTATNTNNNNNNNNNNNVTPIDMNKSVGMAFTTITQMLGMGNNTGILPKSIDKNIKINNVSRIDKNINTNLAMIIDGGVNNVAVINQNVLPKNQNNISYARLRMV